MTRLEALFFTLAPGLLLPKNNIPLPETLPLFLPLVEHEEVDSNSTSLDSKGGVSKGGTSVNVGAAFNLTMGAAYHLLVAFFNFTNDSNIRDIAHPIKGSYRRKIRACKW